MTFTDLPFLEFPGNKFFSMLVVIDIIINFIIMMKLLGLVIDSLGIKHLYGQLYVNTFNKLKSQWTWDVYHAMY